MLGLLLGLLGLLRGLLGLLLSPLLGLLGLVGLLLELVKLLLELVKLLLVVCCCDWLDRLTVCLANSLRRYLKLDFPKNRWRVVSL